MERLARSAVLDVRAPCEKVLEHLLSRSVEDIVGGAARLTGRAEKKGRVVLQFAAATRRKDYRVEVEVQRSGDRIVYRMSGDMGGELRVAALPRGSACRVYVEAEARGPLVEEYGGESLSRIVNRVVVNIVSKFPAIIQPRLPAGKLGDAFVELLSLLNLAVGGQATVAKGGKLRSVAINIDTGSVVSVDGVSEDAAQKLAAKLSNALKPLVEALEDLGAGQPDRIVVSAGNTVLVASHVAGLSVVTILEREREEAGG
jgi:hypothetical protein